MPEKWVDKVTGEVVTDAPVGDPGPLVPFLEEEAA